MASYEKRKDGHWSVRFRIKDEYGKSVSKRLSGFDKKSQAEIAYREFITDHEKYFSDNSEILKTMHFSELVEKYLENKKARVKPSSLYDMKNVIGAQITPYFKNLCVSSITPSKVLSWQNELNSKDFSHKYKINLRGYLSSIFKFACQIYDLRVNPVTKVDPFRNLEPKKEMQIWTIDDFNLFISIVEEPTYHAFFKSLYFGGFRKGELLALSWNDVDFENNSISITKSLTRKVEGKTYAITTPKNSSSIRAIKMPSIVMDSLMEIKPNHYEISDFVFGGEKPLAENTLTRRFNNYCEKANVKKIRIHDFRHSHASLLIEQNENILMISKRLGHSDTTQTLNTYSHLMPNKENELIEKLEKLTKNS